MFLFSLRKIEAALPWRWDGIAGISHTSLHKLRLGTVLIVLRFLFAVGIVVLFGLFVGVVGVLADIRFPFTHGLGVLVVVRMVDRLDVVYLGLV